MPLISADLPISIEFAVLNKAKRENFEKFSVQKLYLLQIVEIFILFLLLKYLIFFSSKV